VLGDEVYARVNNDWNVFTG